MRAPRYNMCSNSDTVVRYGKAPGELFRYLAGGRSLTTTKIINSNIVGKRVYFIRIDREYKVPRPERGAELWPNVPNWSRIITFLRCVKPNSNRSRM